MARRKYMRTRQLKPGMKIDQVIEDSMGRNLVVCGSILDDYIIESLLKLGIMSVYIQDGGDTPEDNIPVSYTHLDVYKRQLVEQLSQEGHDITIIDKNRERISQLANLYDVMGLVGNGASYNIQKEAGIGNADLIIAVTGSDELNLLCCTIATQVGNCAAIARVRTPDYSQEADYLREKLGLAPVSYTHLICHTFIKLREHVRQKSNLISMEILYAT